MSAFLGVVDFSPYNDLKKRGTFLTHYAAHLEQAFPLMPLLLLVTRYDFVRLRAKLCNVARLQPLDVRLVLLNRTRKTTT